MADSADDIKQIISNIESTHIDETSVVSFAGKALKLDTAEHVLPITEAIAKCEPLLTLNLEGNTLGIEAAKQIGKSLESKPTLKYALLKDLFTGRLKTEIPEAILFLSSGIMLSNARLHTLDLSDNAFGPIGMKSVLPFLESEACKTLQVLRLNNNGLGIEGGKLLAKGLKNLENLSTFICGRNRLEIVGAVAIGNALSNMKTLETLEMPQNGIRAEGIEAIADAVKANNSLKTLNLNDNNLKGRGGVAIAEALKTLTAIESINFGDCLLKRSGCVAVCEALNGSTIANLKELILNGNEIGGEEAIEAFANLFSNINENRVKLILSNNNFGESGVEKITEIINSNVELHISDDEGSEEEVEEEEEHENEEEEEETENEDKSRLNGSTKEDSIELDIEKLTKTIENDYANLDDLCSQFVKISIDGYDSNQSKLSEDSLKKCELFLKAAIKKGNERNEFEAMNALLVKMGLLKNENGKYEMVCDLRGPLSALTNNIECLSPPQKKVLQAFMNKPNKSVEQCGSIKHNLMRTLFI